MPHPQVGRVDEDADLGGEDESLVPVEVTQPHDLLHLTSKVLAECPNRRSGKTDSAAAIPCLRRTQKQATTPFSACAPNTDRGVLQVYILPLWGQ